MGRRAERRIAFDSICANASWSGFGLPLGAMGAWVPERSRRHWPLRGAGRSTGPQGCQAYRPRDNTRQDRLAPPLCGSPGSPPLASQDRHNDAHAMDRLIDSPAAMLADSNGANGAVIVTVCILAILSAFALVNW